MNPDLSAHIIQFVADNPLLDGRSWHGWDGTLAYRLGLAPAVPKVSDYADLEPLNPDPRTAPAGALHHFDVAPYGHTVIDVYGGGGTVLEATSAGLQYRFLAEVIRTSRGVYLGWTYHREEN
jgi:hypothetical protein